MVIGSTWKAVTSGVPQGSVFNILVGDMDSGTEFAHDTKLSGAVDILQGRGAIQRHGQA